MVLTVTQREANRQIAKLPKPDTMHRHMWADMQDLLRALVRYMPDIHPTQRTLSDKSKIPLSNVQRLLARAERDGLIRREPIPSPGRWETHAYTLLFLPPSDSCPSSCPTPRPSLADKEETVLTTSVQVVEFAPAAHAEIGAEEEGPQPNRYAGHCEVCTHPLRPYEGTLRGHRPRHRQCASGATDWPRLKEYLMSRYREQYENPATWGTAFGDDPDAPLPTYSAPPAKPQARLAKHFERRWNEALATAKEWRGAYRGIDLGPAIGYIKTKFLDAGYNEEHVTLMIDEFFLDLLDPQVDVMMREGQSCWQLFTGWWGRTPVPDPVPERRRRERLDRLNAAVAAQIAATAQPTVPFRRRVLTRR